MAHPRLRWPGSGGFLKPAEAAWRIRGMLVLDGCDPEGNVVQFKQPEA